MWSSLGCGVVSTEERFNFLCLSLMFQEHSDSEEFSASFVRSERLDGGKDHMIRPGVSRHSLSSLHAHPLHQITILSREARIQCSITRGIQLSVILSCSSVSSDICDPPLLLRANLEILQGELQRTEYPCMYCLS